MKRTIKRIAIVATLSVSLAGAGAVVGGVGPAHADSAAAFCKAIIAAQNLPNDGAQGACTSFFQSHDQSSASFEYFCKTIFVPMGEFTSQGACVSAMNQTK